MAFRRFFLFSRNKRAGYELLQVNGNFEEYVTGEKDITGYYRQYCCL